MFQVLEHIYDVKEFLEHALQVLKKGGKLVIGVPNNEPYFLGYDKYCTLNLPPHHMGLWNIKVFEKFAPIFGLKIISVSYDQKARILTSAYLRAKYMSGVKSLPGKHSTGEKIRMLLFTVFALPVTIYKKIFGQLNGSHLAVLFKKTNCAV